MLCLCGEGQREGEREREGESEKHMCLFVCCCFLLFLLSFLATLARRGACPHAPRLGEPRPPPGRPLRGPRW